MSGKTMNRSRMALGAGLLALAATAASGFGTRAQAQAAAESPMVRIAELEIDPAQLEAYKAILAEEQ